MGQLVFQATLGGQVNLVGPNTASTFNINVPAVAGNMVTTGDTGTVTSTMLATSVYTAPGTIGSGTPNTGAFTTLAASSTVTLSGGTANGVAYLNGSKVLTTGSAFVFDGSNLSVGSTSVGTLTTKQSSEFKGITLVNFYNANEWSFVHDGSNSLRFAYGGGGANAGEKMRLDSSGNLGLGVTPSGWGSSYKAMQLGSLGIAGISIAGNDASIGTNYYINSSSNITYATTGAVSYLNMYNGQFRFYNAPTGTAGTTAAITQAMTLDASGNLIVGDTGAVTGARLSSVAVSGSQAAAFRSPASTSVAILNIWGNESSGNQIFARFATDSNAERGSISYNRAGGLTVFNTTSDYRAKDIYGPVTNSGALIDSVPVYMGKMKWAEQERPMFIAHEVPAYAHTGEKDAVDADGKPVYQQMDASALVPVMWAEIQSLRKRLAAAGI